MSQLPPVHAFPCCRYEEDPERRERFWYTMLGGGGHPPASACPDVTRLVVQQHFNCPSVWAILPLQARRATIRACLLSCLAHTVLHAPSLFSPVVSLNLICACFNFKPPPTHPPHTALTPQDVFALMQRYSNRPAREEIINNPTVSKHYWRYRCCSSHSTAPPWHSTAQHSTAQP